MKPQPRLVLVEDDPSIRRMYERAFSTAGFDVTTSEDGTIIAEVAKMNPPDVILMDIMMPNFNGLEALEELKANVLTRGIPVIMLSAYDNAEIVKRALELGARHYLVKSAYEPQQIVDILNETIAERQKEIEEAKKIKVELDDTPPFL
jgi:CheY-like chemotaxis protein